MTVIIMLGMLLAVFSLVLGVGLAIGGTHKQTDRRINQMKGRWRSNKAIDPDSNVRRSRSDSSLAGLDRIIKRLLPHPETLRQRLERTGKRISIGEYLLASGVSGGVFGLVMGPLLDFGTLIAVIATLFGGLVLPHMVIGHLGARRVKAFIGQFPEAIDLIVRGLRSGLPVTESVKVVSEELRPPVSVEFKTVVDAIGFGKNLDEALWEVARRLDTPEFKFFIVALSVQQETGGNLAETLENLSDVLRKRRQMKLKIKALASEPKASAMILGSLPFIMFGLIATINFGYISQLFIDPRGHSLIAAGLISQAIGVAVMIKMTKFEI